MSRMKGHPPVTGVEAETPACTQPADHALSPTCTEQKGRIFCHPPVSQEEHLSFPAYLMVKMYNG